MKSLALVGNPNVGKSTLFNALTGLQHRTGNYPGVTVEWKAGVAELGVTKVELVDLPGTYSLEAISPDEAVVAATLHGQIPSRRRPDGIVALVDASNPERNLYLLSQLLELGLPCVVALNMGDVAAAKGMRVEAQVLQTNLGVPVVPIQAQQRLGLDELRRAMAGMLNGAACIPSPPICQDARAIPMPELIRRRYAWARRMLVDALRRPETPLLTASDRWDKILTHKLWGTLAFLVLMVLVFQSIFSWAQPAMELLELLLAKAGSLLLSPLPPGSLRSLLQNGVLAGFSAVAIFLPQIAILFLFITLLEDCGYMARAVFLMDKLFARLGLSGRSFIPLFSSFACAVPGIMATRSIASSRERLVTLLVAPLMSCSARLPLYIILIAAFVPSGGPWIGLSWQGLALLGMYLIGALTAVPVVLAFKRLLMRNISPLFLMELPTYKLPDARTVGRRIYHQCRSFVVRAGTVIVAVSVLVWALSSYPRLEGEERDSPSAQLSQSYLGRIGQSLAPAFRPLGWDWRITVAALASFPAREVVVSTLGTIFSLQDNAGQRRLQERLQEARGDDGQPLFNLAVALSLMVFFALCAQCLATLAVIAQESGSWKWAAFSFCYMTGLAWLGALATYQGARWLGA